MQNLQPHALRPLQTGRDLFGPDPDKLSRGLLALGGIDSGPWSSFNGRRSGMVGQRVVRAGRPGGVLQPFERHDR
jgi:hypothetical protein